MINGFAEVYDSILMMFSRRLEAIFDHFEYRIASRAKQAPKRPVEYTTGRIQERIFDV
jgi:hypothetical protein